MFDRPSTDGSTREQSRNMEASKQLLPRRNTAVGTVPQSVLTKLANIDEIPFKYQYRMQFGKNRGELFRRANGTGHFEWKQTISKTRYDLLLELKHSNIVNIDEGEWKYSIDDDDLRLECVLRITNPIESTTPIGRGLTDLHRMSVDDVIDWQGEMSISDAHHMCKNVRNYVFIVSIIIEFWCRFYRR